MDFRGATTKPPYRGLKSAENLRSVLKKAREILAMSRLTPIGSRLKTKSECSMSDLSDCGSQGSEYGYSALHEAIIPRDLEYMDFLLKAGCDLEQRDENGFTVLHVATLEKAVEAVDRLITAGSNVESLTKEGMSSLHIAVEIPDNDQVLTHLAASDSNINIRNKVGRTALHLAARGGNLEYLKILLDEGCDREIKDKFGMKAVDAARARNHGECVELLLSYVPQKRCLKISEDKNNTVEKRLDNRRKHLSNGSSKLSANKTSKTCGNDFKAEERLVLEDETTRNDRCSLTLPEILVCELEQENSIEKARVLVEEETRVTQIHICTISDKQVVDIENSVKEQESCRNDIGKINSEVAKDFVNSVDQTVEDCEDSGKQMDKKEKDVNGNAWERNEILTTEFLKEKTEDITSSEQFDVRKTDENGISTAVPFLSVMLNKSGENGRSISESEHLVKFSCRFKDPAEDAPKMPLQSIKFDNNFSEKKFRVSILPKTTRIAVDSGELLKLLTKILEPKHNREGTVDNNIKCSELARCKEECLLLVRFIPVSLISVKLREEDFLHLWKLNVAVTNGWIMNGFGKGSHGLESKKIISQVLKGLRMSMNGAISACPNRRRPLEYDKQNLSQSVLQNGEKQKLQNDTCQDEDLLELFIKACRTIKTQPSDAYATLEEFCDKIYLKNRTEFQDLTRKVFICCNLPNCSVKSEVKSIDFGRCLEALDYVVRYDKCPVHFLSAVLDSIMTQREYLNQVLKSRADFLEYALNRTISCEEKIWDEDKIVEIFLLFCSILENQVGTLCRLVDVLLGQALSRPDINNMVLSSCILVRMGLLKSEFKVEIIENLKGPLNALQHVFAQDYFPRSLAGLFVSFLAKPGPRFSRLRDLHNQTLKSALLKEILPQPKDQNTDVLGKGLKRICDVLAHREYWETADQCCEALLTRTLESTNYREIELGQSILVYFGLIKSEDKLETIKDIGTGLRLLQHVANGNHIPQSIALMVSIFLKKERKRLESYKDDLENLLNILQN